MPKSVLIPSDTPSNPTIAVLTLKVEYDTLPDSEDVREVVEKAKELGRVTIAELDIHVPAKIDLR